MVSTTFLFQFYNQFSSVIYILALCIMQMPTNLTFMQVKVKTWIKIAEPTLILLSYLWSQDNTCLLSFIYYFM